jgi:hypothetical protein
VLTFDCAANRALGLDDATCRFYRSDLTDLNRLADEIVDLVRAHPERDEQRQAAIRGLFAERHTYRARWRVIGHQIATRVGATCH